MHKKPSTYLIAGLSIILLALFFYGYIPRFFQTRKIEHIAYKESPIKVMVKKIAPVDTPLTLTLPSKTAAHHVTPIWARADGYLQTLYVDIGDKVREGQTLAVLDTPEVDKAYLQAVSDYEVAKASRDIAQKNADRARNTYEKDRGAISQLDVDQYLATLEEAENTLEAQAANVARNRALLDFKYITAPFDGIITERDVDIGALISSGSSAHRLLVIESRDIIRLFVAVPQSYCTLISEGMEGTTKIREYGDKVYKSKVARFAKALDPISHTMLTELHISNPDDAILTGLYSEITFSFTPNLPYYMVPTPAAIIRTGAPQIAVLDDKNIAHLKTVTIGLDYGNAYQITSGLNPGDRIIINPTEKIQDGVSCVVN